MKTGMRNFVAANCLNACNTPNDLVYIQRVQFFGSIVLY